MKNLTILVQPHRCSFVKKIITMFVKMGCTVYVVSQRASTNKEIVDDVEIKTIAPQNIKTIKFDFMLALVDSSLNHSIPKIEISIEEGKQHYKISSYVTHKGKNARVSYKKVLSRLAISDSLFTLFKETIDTLTRIDTAKIEFTTEVIPQTTFQQWLNADLAMEALEYRLTSYPKAFDLGNCSGELCELEMCLQPFKSITRTDFELICLSILSLMNEAKETVLFYNIYYKNKWIRKLIKVSPDDCYESLSKKCLDNIYDVADNPFYFRQTPCAQINIEYDCPPSSTTHSLTFAYHSESNTLKISYHSEIQPLVNLSGSLSKLLDAYKLYVRNEIKLKEMLDFQLTRKRIRASNTQVTSVHKNLFTDLDKHLLDPELAHKIAVTDVAKQQEYTYATLTQDSKHLAIMLTIERSLSPSLAVWSEQGYNQVVASLAIMKSGHAYLPICQSWDQVEVDKVLSLANVEIVLISKKQYQQLDPCTSFFNKFHFLVIEHMLDEAKGADFLAAQVKTPIVSEMDPAYVIYHLGLATPPHVVSTIHSDAIDSITATTKQLKLTAHDKSLSLSPFCSDLFVQEVFSLLSIGGSIIFPKQEESDDPRVLADLINRYGITVWHTGTQWVNELV